MIYNVLEYLEEAAAKFPDKLAFVDERNEIRYGNLLQEAQTLLVLQTYC
ncbi:MAG: hypothetical protein ACOVK9_06570 [Bacteroidia bacterium]